MKKLIAEEVKYTDADLKIIAKNEVARIAIDKFLRKEKFNISVHTSVGDWGGDEPIPLLRADVNFKTRTSEYIALAIGMVTPLSMHITYYGIKFEKDFIKKIKKKTGFTITNTTIQSATKMKYFDLTNKKVQKGFSTAIKMMKDL